MKNNIILFTSMQKNFCFNGLFVYVCLYVWVLKRESGRRERIKGGWGDRNNTYGFETTVKDVCIQSAEVQFLWGNHWLHLSVDILNRTEVPMSAISLSFSLCQRLFFFIVQSWVAICVEMQRIYRMSLLFPVFRYLPFLLCLDSDILIYRRMWKTHSIYWIKNITINNFKRTLTSLRYYGGRVNQLII